MGVNMNMKKLITTLKNSVKKVIKNVIVKLYHLEIKILPLQKDMIVFESNMGRNYTGNPRCIYEEMVRQGLDKKFRCYYLLDDVNIQIQGNAKKIRRSRLCYYFIMAKAGIIVCDSRQPEYIRKKKGACFIQTWHGTPLKKLALDMDSVSMDGETDLEKYKKTFYQDSRAWDYLISQNRYSTDIFRRAFAFDKKVLEIGYPRNDILFSGNNPEYIENLKKEMGLPLDKKVLLYAPTWRDNQFYNKGAYKFASTLDFDLLQEKLGKDYVCIVKYHYLVKDQLDWSKYKGFVYQFDMCEDIAQLYLAADMMITDYSSVMFDYSILKRPMLFFAYDLEDYKDNLRGFYFDFMEEAPGPVTRTTAELIKAIQQYNPKDYEEKYKAFHQKYNHADDGNASKKMVQLIEELLVRGGK
ncbi:CDP-glycerol glycerophosphotransferase family protein [Anaerocolumna aminovalerica]|uniref:CDP-glycerol glycerophosphotransferase family protein n=1 Tax=Anaerocolumna aminovalerica TaxID=1527 RepID=UPI0020A115CC|nr:CDP-glycerol glycerophosphotransferase family protein [Anaerocolumna aminovalerica]